MEISDIQRQIEQDAQVIQERIPAKMTKDEIKKKGEALKALMASEGWNQTKVARMLGVSNSVISQFLRGKYKGDIGKVVNKITNLVNTAARRKRRVKNVLYIETSVARRIGMLVSRTETFSEEESRIGLIIGDGGHGKSRCLEQYAKANRNSVYVELDRGMYATLIFAAIADALDIDSSGSLAAVSRRLIEHLQNRQFLIMLDEASNLTVKQLDLLRQILVVKARCPLILAGNGDLLKTVMQPTTRRGFESLDQFTSRLMAILDLNAEAANENDGLYTVEDIRRLYEYGGIRLTGDAIKTLRRICKTPRSGRFRTCSIIIDALHAARNIEKLGQIDTVAILSMIGYLRLPVKVWLPIAIREKSKEQSEKAATKAG